MEQRLIGSTDLEVSSLGMGCAKLGAFWQGRSPRDGVLALRAARECGITLFDTADCYARGLSERLIGRAFSSGSTDVVVCTKVGLIKTPLALASAERHGSRRDPATPPLRAALRGMGREAGAQQCFEPDYIRRATERSVRRLGRGRIDLLLLHGPSVDVLDHGRFLTALERLVTAGHVRHWGVSADSDEAATAALRLPGLACLQLPHNLLRQGLVARVGPQARKAGVGILTAGVLGDGALIERAEHVGLPRDEVLTAGVNRALQVPGVASVLVGMSSEVHVRQNIGAAARVVDADAQHRITQALSTSGS